MPETRIVVRWPDGEEEQLYSPSTVIKDYLSADTSYPLEEFLQRAEQGLSAASERVQLKFGFACSAAADQWSRIHGRAQVGGYDSAAKVYVQKIE
ncbi:MAG: MSMEG_0570 family nitrogen starvation response protein [Pseudomonadota bacterium]